MATADEPLTGVLDELSGTGREEAVSVDDMLEAFQHRSLGFMLTLLGLLAALPIIGDIPGASILLGSLILVVIAQHAIGRGRLWAPAAVRRQKIRRDRFDRAIEVSRPWTQRVDRLLRPRLTSISAGSTNRTLIAGAAALLALTFYPLAFVPFGVNAPALGVMALGLGLMSRDGLFVAIGYGFAALTVYVMSTAL